MNQLTPKQQEWINRFTKATSDAGDGASEANLEALNSGLINWYQFMARETKSYIEWKCEELEMLWEE